MKPSTKLRAWEADPYWNEVGTLLAGGKKLRPDHYLQGLDAEELEQLRAALSTAGSFAEQRLLCPRRVGGDTDGSLPPASLLSKIAQAMREVSVLHQLEAQQLIETAAKKRCGEIGLNTQLTDAVVHIVGEEALRQRAEGQVGKFAVSAASLLIKREKQTDAKKTDQQRALEFCLEEAKGFPEVQELFKAAFAGLKKAKSSK